MQSRIFVYLCEGGPVCSSKPNMGLTGEFGVCVGQNVVKHHNFSRIFDISTFCWHITNMLTACTTKCQSEGINFRVHWLGGPCVMYYQKYTGKSTVTASVGIVPIMWSLANFKFKFSSSTWGNFLLIFWGYLLEALLNTIISFLYKNCPIIWLPCGQEKIVIFIVIMFCKPSIAKV